MLHGQIEPIEGIKMESLWELVTEDEAIEAAIARHGKDPTTSVACCAFELSGHDKDDPDYRF